MDKTAHDIQCARDLMTQIVGEKLNIFQAVTKLQSHVLCTYKNLYFITQVKTFIRRQDGSFRDRQFFFVLALSLAHYVNEEKGSLLCPNLKKDVMQADINHSHECAGERNEQNLVCCACAQEALRRLERYFL